jgi:hypothetical protein
MYVCAQTAQAVPAPDYNTAAATGVRVDSVPGDIARISRSVESLNRNLEKFFSNFSSNQGLKLSDRQQRLLFALEVLSRTETGLANAQRQRLDHVERQSRLRLQLAGVKDNLLPQSIERYASTRGTTNSVELRESRRAALEKERLELTNTVDQIQNELDRLTEVVRRGELQVAALRDRLFGEVEKELADL